jgi:hypothetical protein
VHRHNQQKVHSMKARFSFLAVLAVLSIALVLAFAANAQETTPTPEGQMPEMTQEAYGSMDMGSQEIDPDTAKLIDDVRHSTADFRDFSTVEGAGYAKFLDCFTNNNVGGMGQHFVNGELAGDDALDPMKPEALVYEPSENGDMILVAFEYLVFADQWDPNNTGRPAPVLFDRPLHLISTIPNTPPVWALHLWLWTDNPNGVFSDFNPLVFCPAGQPVTDMTPAS